MDQSEISRPDLSRGLTTNSINTYTDTNSRTELLKNEQVETFINEVDVLDGLDIDEEHKFQENVYTTKLYRDGVDSTPVVLYPLDYQKCTLIYLQVVSCVLIFTIFGLNDQTTGSLMPILTEYYQVSELQVSYVFLMQVLGYTISALINGSIHKKIGRRGIMVGSGCLFIVFIFILSLKPIFPIYCICFFPIGVAIGLIDSTVNVLFANFTRSKNEILGIIHGTYGVASMITPVVVARLDKANWNKFFYLPFSVAIVGTAMAAYAFKHETSAKYNYLCNEPDLVSDEEDNNHDNLNSIDNIDTDNMSQQEDEFGNDDSFLNLIKQPVIIMYALYVFSYQGLQSAVGTWLFTYLLKVKNGGPKTMSLVLSFFWAGLTIGRFFLGTITSRFFRNEYFANKWYGYFAVISFSGMYFLSSFNFEYSFILIMFTLFVFFAGFWIAPMFPNVNVVMMGILPPKYQVQGVGISISLGISGTAAVPSIFGFLVNIFGYSGLPLMYIGGICFLQGIWLLYPFLIKTKNANKILF